MGEGDAKTIWLVGMMGAGKSAVGRRLAAALGVPFVDTDAIVEAAAGMEVAAIFDSEGEARFREREREAIEAWAGRPAVVALGGGAIAQPGAAGRLCATGRVVYLKAAAETLLARVGDAEARPLLRGLAAPERLERIRNLLRERASHYECAQHVVVTDHLEPAEVADAVAAELR